jgi:hypothetical protein
MGRENELKFRVICQVEDVLDETPLTSANFNVTTSESDVLLITSKISPDYLFRMKKPNNYSCEVQPGEIHLVDRFGFSSVPDSYPRIKIWANHVAEDVRIRQERLEQDKLISNWEKVVDSKYPNAEQPLNLADFELWKKVVADLQTRVAELEKKGKLTPEQASEILAEGEAVEQQSSSMPGGAWMRKAGKYLVLVLKYVSQDAETRHYVISHFENAVKELPAHIETAKTILEAIPR